MEHDIIIPLISGLQGIFAATISFELVAGFAVMLLLLVGSGLMSASEVAFFSLRPEDIETIRNNRSRRSQTLISLYEMPEKLLSTILVANNAINITIVLLAAMLSSIMFDFSANPVMGFIVEVIVITFIILFFGEILPKVYASRNNITLALFMALSLSVLEKLFRPVTSILLLSTSFVKKRAGFYKSSISMNDLSDALELASDELNEDGKILKGIVNFGNINVSAIMCPRIDVTAVDVSSGFRKIIPVIISSGFSRIPAYSDNFDNVKGILYAKDVLPFMNKPDSFKWQSLLRPPYYVPETKKINDLLKEFQVKKIHMAVVIDEYGGTSGIVTLEDILEEIVGEITDESDEDEILYRIIDESTYIFEGKILLNDFCRILHLEDNYFGQVRGESETLAGLILEMTGEIPEKNRTIQHGVFLFMIESADRRRIKQVRVKINSKEDEKGLD